LKIYGVDFTCAPRKAKPITVAVGVLQEKAARISEILRLESFQSFEDFLGSKGPWVGGFDFPFSMPAEVVRDLGWPTTWSELTAYLSSLTREQLRKTLDTYRASRPVGSKYAHRATDVPAGSSSPMKLVNPPVALMFHEGARRLAQAGVHVPALMKGDRSRVALEAYPGLLVRKQLGLRASYKSDARSEQTRERKAIRRKVVKALLAGKPLGVRLDTHASIQNAMIDDGSGDMLDAVICAVQAAWAVRRADYGFPRQAFAGEGWIISATLE
jgi:hypothetical protein